MNQSHIVKLFTALGLTLLIISVNTWLVVQGGEKVLGISLISNEKAGAAFLGLMLCSVLLLLVAAVGLLHARRYGQNWHSRVPVVWLEGLDTSKKEAKLFQILIVILFFLVPIGAMVHFKEVVEDSWLCDQNKVAKPEQVKTVYFKGLAGPTGQTRLVRNQSQTRDCEGIEVFPHWEFVLVAIFVVASFLMSATFIFSLFVPLPAQSLQEIKT